MNLAKGKKEVHEQEIKRLQEELEKAKQEVELNKNKYLRSLADYQNYEKRVIQEKAELVANANRELLIKLLPFLDHLEKAEIFIKDKGLKLIRDNFYQTIREVGVEEIDVLGKEFDPHLAEAVEVIEGKQDNIVVDVIRKGYRFQGKILRVAHVKVSKKKVEKKAQDQAKEELLKGDYM